MSKLENFVNAAKECGINLEVIPNWNPKHHITKVILTNTEIWEEDPQPYIFFTEDDNITTDRALINDCISRKEDKATVQFVAYPYEVHWENYYEEWFCEWFDSYEEAKKFYDEMVENAICTNYVYIELTQGYYNVLESWKEEEAR